MSLIRRQMINRNSCFRILKARQQPWSSLIRNTFPVQSSRLLHSSRTLLSKKENITKSQLLEQASSSLSRLWIHIKWPLTRNNRPFSLDDFSAFASWLLMGNVLWIILGTTTFGLVTMYSIDTFDRFWNVVKGEQNLGSEDKDTKKKLNDDSFLGFIASSILSQGLGLKFVFQKGNVVPEFADGMLKFKNLKVYSTKSPAEELSFIASIQELNLSLSFKKWYKGNGLIYDMEIFGMDATVYKNLESVANEAPIKDKSIPLSSMALSFSKYNDRTYNDIDEHGTEQLERLEQSPKLSLLAPNYEFSHVKIHDSVIALYEGTDRVPLKISIFSGDLPRLRGSRLLLDFFNANNVAGAVNDAMFTIHKHQTFLNNENVVRFKLDGIDMGSLSKANPQLKFNWIANGKAEIIANIRLPPADGAKEDGHSNAPLLSGIFQKLLDEFKVLTSPKEQELSNEHPESSLVKSAVTAIYETFSHNKEEKPIMNEAEYVIVDVKVKFTDLKATLPQELPLASSSLVPFVSLQELRSLISYVNEVEPDSDHPIIINTTVIEKMSDLYNLDNISQTRLFDVIVSDIYDDFSKLIKLEEKRIIEEKSNMWSHSLASQLLLLGLGVLA